ncbi:hypothetical protein [Pseudonocardia lacus]|uniref:hypothetical protein n=1 Tax=Pseudonocardia lacus TaxID=2835865 RepID=UPI001BDDAD62|nr:hypothetical protein [Pseudonocardia lacus]
MTVPGRGTMRERTSSGRRIGSLLLVVLSAVTLVAVHVWPGWTAVPFLTPATTQVLGVFTGSLVLTMVVQALDALIDGPRLRAAGDVATSAMGVVVAARVWQVFPFRFDPAGFDWAVVVRVLLVLGMVGAAIGVLTAGVVLARGGGTDRT